MSRFYSYLNSASNIIDLYKGEMPFAVFLKQYFAKEKKFGSKDRKQISALCYNYFRVANALNVVEKEEQFLIASFLCESTPNPILAFLKPEFNDSVEQSLSQKLEILGGKVDVNKLFPLVDFVSDKLDKKLFSESITIQPDLFIRLRPKTSQKVIETLSEAQIQFQKINEITLALPNASKLPESLIADKDYSVQDASSQQVGLILKSYLTNLNTQSKVWDCCAASGGKSIMLHDLGFNYQLFVSDIRESILTNLSNRFQIAGITKYAKFIADLTSPNIKTPVSKFDVIIADVPCSGSGTWGRTPEQLSYFKPSDLEVYTNRQLKIVENLGQFLDSNGILVYITCSVFETENENIVSHICQNGFELIHSEYILGYNHKADSMFLSILKKK